MFILPTGQKKNAIIQSVGDGAGDQIQGVVFAEQAVYHLTASRIQVLIFF